MIIQTLLQKPAGRWCCVIIAKYAVVMQERWRRKLKVQANMDDEGTLLDNLLDLKNTGSATYWYQIND